MELEHGGLVKEEYQEIRTIFNNGREPIGLTNVVVDPFQELIWTGNQSVSELVGKCYKYKHVGDCLMVCEINWSFVV
jgi:hypothetical protein